MSNHGRPDVSILLHAKKEFHAGRTSIIDPQECSSSTRDSDHVDRALESRNENLLFFFGFLLYLYLSIVMKDVTRIETDLRY